MNLYTLIDEAGAVVGEFCGRHEDLLLNLRAGQSYVNGAAQGDVWDGYSWIATRPSAHQQLAQSWEAARAKRDALLQSTDWRVVRAMELGEPLGGEWQIYRQMLRDITQQPDPKQITWPQVPVEGS